MQVFPPMKIRDFQLNLDRNKAFRSIWNNALIPRHFELVELFWLRLGSQHLAAVSFHEAPSGVAFREFGADRLDQSTWRGNFDWNQLILKMNLTVVRADELFIYRLDVRIICSQLGANGMQMKLQICLRSQLMSVHLLFATVYTIGCKFLCNVSNYVKACPFRTEFPICTERWTCGALDLQVKFSVDNSLKSFKGRVRGWIVHFACGSHRIFRGEESSAPPIWLF